MRKYRFTDHTADIAADVRADSYEELFTASAEALAYSISDAINFRDKISHNLSLSSISYEELLVGFLNELNYLAEVKKMIYLKTEELAISEKENIFELSSRIMLGKIEIGTELKNEIKAITYHQMKIGFNDGVYSTRIVFDI